MSSQRSELLLTTDARNDLRKILSFTKRTWGLEQAALYRQLLFERLDLLLTNPQLGRERDDIAPGARSIPVQEHLAYYEIPPNRIVVLRILHPRRQFPKRN
jgi:toxin ParE1/3/4